MIPLSFIVGELGLCFYHCTAKAALALKPYRSLARALSLSLSLSLPPSFPPSLPPSLPLSLSPSLCLEPSTSYSAHYCRISPANGSNAYAGMSNRVHSAHAAAALTRCTKLLTLQAPGRRARNWGAARWPLAACPCGNRKDVLHARTCTHTHYHTIYNTPCALETQLC